MTEWEIPSATRTSRAAPAYSARSMRTGSPESHLDPSSPTENSDHLAILKAEVEAGASEVLGRGCPERAVYLLRQLREGESLSRDVSTAGRVWPWLLEAWP